MEIIDLLHVVRTFANIFPSEYVSYSHVDYLQIGHECTMVNVPNVILKFFAELAMIPTVHLGPPSNAWANFMAAELLLGIQWQILNEQRPWSYQGHFTL